MLHGAAAMRRAVTIADARRMHAVHAMRGIGCSALRGDGYAWG
jgi:hypothetical protein